MLKTTACRRLARRPPQMMRLGIVIALLCGCLRLGAQTAIPEVPSTEEVRQLAAKHRWQDIALLLGPLRSRSADQNFYYGTALARLGRWHESENAFRTGLRLAPNDPRFPIELAGVAFKLKRYPEATHHLRRALMLAPQDAYANDFLGTVYFLQGNLEAALKYWNRVGKPQTERVTPDHPLKIRPELLDHALTLSPAAPLALSDLLTSRARVEGLGVFFDPAFQLAARDDGNFDVILNLQERNGWGNNAGE